MKSYVLGKINGKPVKMKIYKMIIMLVFMLPILIIAVPCFYLLKLAIWLASERNE